MSDDIKIVEPKTIRAENGSMRFEFTREEPCAWLEVSKAEAMAFFDLVDRKPPGYGMTATVLFTELSQAYEADLQAERTHRAIDPLGGPAVAEWVRDLARNYLTWSRALTDPAPVVDPAQTELPIDPYAEAAQSVYPEGDKPRQIRVPAALGAGYGLGKTTFVGDYRRLFVMPEVEKDLQQIDDSYIDQAVASPEGRLWMAYTARLVQYESAYGVASTTLSARIDCMRRAMTAEGIK